MPTTPPAAPGAAPTADRRPVPRRDFLRLAALAPLAPLAAGCAAALRVGPARPEPAAGPTPSTGASEPLEALEAVRAFPLPADAEPAALFRAAVPRGRGG